MTRRVSYISGSRADFGLMKSTLLAIAEDPALLLDVVVTGMHLSREHGHTVDEIRAAGLAIRAQVPVDLHSATGANMARNIGVMTTGFVDALMDDPPDLLLLLGDRGEMLAGAIVALHLNLAIAHIHGGERSGTVDEPVRHAISKLSHYHFVATQESCNRLVRMGELPDCIFVTGAPGLQGLADLAVESRVDLCASLSLNPLRPVALMVFHPVLQEDEHAGRFAASIMSALATCGVQVVALMPNSDAGSGAIRDVLHRHAALPDVRVLTHLPRCFVAWMAACDFMIGNSSAGIIEAATFGTPVLNLGSRQYLRERNSNVVDVPMDDGKIGLAIDGALTSGRRRAHNVYGDGNTAARVTSLLRELPIGTGLRPKINGY